MTGLTPRQVIILTINSTGLISLTPPFPKDYPALKSAEEAIFQCQLQGLFQAQDAPLPLKKVPSTSNQIKDFKASRH